MFDIYKIPSSSMENTLFPNDIIIVNKLKYGPRLPQSPFEIPWVNMAFYFNDTAKKRIKENWWPYKRLSGTTKIKQGDVFVFNLGFSKDFFVVKRCMGLAGDTLKIQNGSIYTNNKLFTSPDTEKNNYQFKTNDHKQLYKKMDSLSINAYSNNRMDSFNCTLTKKEAEELKHLLYVYNFKQQIDTFNVSKEIVNKSINNKWTYDNMGPFVIPKKEMQILLNSETFLLYKRVLNEFENFPIEQKGRLFYVHNIKVETYTFKQDYYFMMGDNRKGTIDSRSWGFLPESNIVGKVQYVLWSNYQDEFQWGRFFKAVN